MLNAQGDLYAAELAFFSLSLLFCIVLVIKYGIRRRSVWILLSILATLRIIGSAAIVYAQSQQDASKILLEIAAITSAVGTAPLLFSWMDCQRTLLANIEAPPISTRWFRGIQVSGTVAIILAIVGGMHEVDGGPDSKTFLEAAAIMFLIIFVGLLFIFVVIWTGRKRLDSALIRVCAAVVPFIAIRTAFTLGVGFSNPGGAFYFENTNIWIAAFMQFLPEAVFMILLVVYGLVASKPLPPQKPNQLSGRDISGRRSFFR